MQNFGVDSDSDGNLRLFSSDGVTTSIINTDIVAKDIPYKVECDIERGCLQLYALIDDVWTLEATETTITSKQTEILKELKKTVEKLTMELDLERKGKKKFKLQEIKLNLGVASLKFGRS